MLTAWPEPEPFPEGYRFPSVGERGLHEPIQLVPYCQLMALRNRRTDESREWLFDVRCPNCRTQAQAELQKGYDPLATSPPHMDGEHRLSAYLTAWESQ